ncbi:gas vesicle protein [Salinibacter ruber]|uniref:Gas vesicle protein n=1 Tax=Salinibacter ruber TaxID=146919 RepID=A0A9X2TCQ3_9BACT|nr:hypothetical protein [Salinibacter ruber]MCS3676229.1 gas vesicle protein [Salinibacter ruber]MCS3679516.1 gas vesicle protein [Salinibacter ruber]
MDIILVLFDVLGFALLQESPSKPESPPQCEVAFLGCDVSISTLVAAVSAIAAAASLYFAFRQTRANIEANRNDKRARAAEIKHRYYDAMVSSRVLPIVDSYRESVSKVVKNHKKEIENLHEENASSERLHKQVQKMGDEFQTIHYQMIRKISEPLESWGEEEITSKVREKAKSIEDEVANMVPSIMHRESKDPDIIGKINEITGKIERNIRDYDPLVQAFGDDYPGK